MLWGCAGVNWCEAVGAVDGIWGGAGVNWVSVCAWGGYWRVCTVVRVCTRGGKQQRACARPGVRALACARTHSRRRPAVQAPRRVRAVRSRAG